MVSLDCMQTNSSTFSDAKIIMPKVYCISLGPGDPELITLKAVRLLTSSDIIYCPGTRKGDEMLSRAGELLSVVGIDSDRIRYFTVPMNPDRTEAQAVYHQVATDIAAACRAGRRVSFVAEGDSGFYSSVHYISDDLTESEIEVEHIAGIPAFIASGAMAGLHIVKQDDPLLVLPSTSSSEQLIYEVSGGRTIVLMKLSRQEQVVKSALRELNDIEVHYFENVGIAGKEYHTTSVEAILERTFPYFSLMMIKKK